MPRPFLASALINVRKTMKKASLIAILSSISIACTGPEGPEGPEGPQGPDGDPALATEVTGTVADASGAVPEGVPVFLVAIDDRGVSIGSYGGTLTDASGAFSISVDDGVAASSRLAVVAGEDSEMHYAASLSATTDLAVDPVSTGVLMAVKLITESPAGRTLRDYTPAEMAELYDSASQELSQAGTDLSDHEAVLRDIIEHVGGVIADRSEGTIDVTPPISVSAPPDIAVAIGSFPHDLTDVNGYIYDITSSGQINNGMAGDQGDAYDRGFRLLVNGSEFSAASGSLEDGTEVAVGPSMMSGLQVTRKIHLAPGDSMVRYTEILQNPGGSDVTVNVEIAQYLGSDENTVILATSSGDLEAGTNDRWLVTDDALEPGSPDAINAFWFGGATSRVTFDLGNINVSYAWDGVTVPAGGRRTFIHYGFMARNPYDAPTVTGMLDSLPPVMGDELSGITQADLDANQSFSPGGAILGGAGSVASYADVTVTNEMSNNSIQVTANSDGSFVADVGGASNDTIRITANDGTDTTLSLP